MVLGQISTKQECCNNTNLNIKYRIKDDVILKSKNAVIRLHSIVTEFMNKAFRFQKNESTCDILCSNWYNPYG